MEHRIALMEQRLQQVAEDVSDTKTLLRKTLYGTNGHVGMTVRLDRLEQWKATTSKFVWMLVGGMISSLGGIAYILRG